MELENTDASQTLELVYWDMRGIAQPIRHLMEYMGVAYT